MVNLYSENQIESLNKRKKKSLIFIFAPLAVVLPLFVLFNILAKTNTRALYITLSSLVLAAYAINFIYQVMENLILSNDKIKHIQTITSKETKIIEGEIVSISEPTTLKRNIKVNELELKIEEKTFRVYLNVDFKINDFKVKSKVKLCLVDNYIKEYEVNDEK